jgi:hypothetical protein
LRVWTDKSDTLSQVYVGTAEMTDTVL